ncbi:MAG TPA: Ig-like domain-containing protein [Candidatus Acidoferrum sp.]
MSISLRRNSSAIRTCFVPLSALLLLLGGGFSQVQAAGITLVQHVGKDAGTTTTSTLAFASPNTAGNFIAVVIRGGLSSSQVFTVTDSNGNTYKQAAQIGSSGSAVTDAIYYAENIKGGADTITASMTVSGPLRFAILEYSGVATSNSLDVAVVATATSTAPNSGNVTTTVSGDLLLGSVGTADSVAFTAGTGFTIRDSVPAAPGTKLIDEDQIQPAAGSISASATLSPSSSWGAILAAFKPAGGVAGSPASITVTAGTPQSATVGTAFGTQLQATVKDSFNNPVNGATVTFTVPGSGASGTFAGGVTTATTNASGVATAAVFTANATAGGYTVTATVSGVATAANFSLTNLAGSASTITASAGTPQSAMVNTAFATQLQATVKDSFGNGVSGVTVTFSVPGSGASGTFAGGVTTATTNASGVATAAVFSANTTAGAYAVSASASGVGTQATFSLTNLAGGASSITATAGTPQSATVNTAFATQLQATVKDSFNNPVSGVTVTFTTPASGASGTFAGGAKTATTNASGVATAAVFTANTTAGAYNVTASVSGVGTSASFSLTNLPGSAASIAATAGTPQSASINTAFATQLQATVKDSFGNGVSGVTVTFTAPGSGASGTFAGGVNTATTNASGVATAAAFTANATSGGPYTVTASASGVSGSASFSLTNLGNPPANIVASAGTPQSATINTAFAAQLQVTVTDSGNNPVNGVTVTFAAPGSGASGTFAGGVNTATTNASGVATSAVFTANSTAGSYTLTASVSGVATPANFSLTNLTGAAASITATAGTPQSATVGTAFATQFQVTVKDAGGNLVNGVTVTFAAPGSGASGTFAAGVNTATTNASGVATAAMFTANTTAGAYTVTASVGGVGSPANLLLTNLAGSAASITATAGTPQSATVNTAFAAQLQSTVKDSFNNPVSGVTVTFTTPASGASGTFAGGVNTATTNASGVATAPVFTANSVAGGPYTVTGSAPGVGTSASFSLTNTVSTAAPIALVQHISKDAGTTTTSTLAFASPNTAGNFIAVAIRGGLSSSQVFTVSDSNSNSYKQAKQLGSTGSTVTTAIYYAENIKGGANTVTVTMSVSGPLRFAVLEYSNVASSNSLDATAAATSTNTSPNSGNLTTTANGDLLLGTVATADSVTFTAGTGYTIRDVIPASGSKIITEDQLQSAAGTASALATLSASSSWGAVLAAFKPATGGGGAGTPASIAATVGTPQNATVNTAFAVQLQATVKDSLNNPVSGVTVTFAAPGSGASGAFAGGVTTATTNASGVATAAVFTANTVAGSYTVTASVSGVSTPANFSLTNVPGSAASIAATAGTPQSSTINTAFATQLQATVKDSFGNGVTGVTVTFTAPGSGASGTFAGGVNTATTNASGIATAAVFTANGVTGSYTVTASASGVGTSANFSLTNVSAPPASITATAGTPQSATVNTAFTTSFQVTVKDASNNPVSGVTVTFTAPGSGASGTFAGGVTTAATNSSGVATAAAFTANGTAGTYTLTATVSGVATPANFSLTNLAGPAANIAATAGTPQSAAINTAFATNLQATVTDSLNNPLSGVTVTFTALASGASGTFTGGLASITATTNASGVATAAVFTANGTTGGPYTVTASVSGVANPANFSLTNVAGANIALVQHGNLDASPSPSGALAFAKNTTAGNWIGVCIRGGLSSSQVFTVSDSSANTYHQAFQMGLTTAVTFACYYAENIKGGADTVTVSESVTGPLRFAIYEYANVATSNSLDATPAVAQGSNASPNSGNLTTNNGGDLLLGIVVTTNSGTFTAGTGYTIEDTVPAPPNAKLIVEDQLQSSAGTASAAVTLGGADNWGAGLAAFRSTSGVSLPITVSISPTSASVPSGYGTQAFTVTIQNDFKTQGVTLALSGTGCSGSTCGTLTQVTATSVTYNAPANVPSPATVTLTATSVSDPTKSASATITVTQGALHVSISPRRTGVTMAGSQTVQFTASTLNDPQNLGVTWQVDGNNGGSASTGTISATGLFTPGTLAGQHTVTAVSNANSSVSASAMVAVTDLTGVYTQHNDNARTGQNLQEYGLTTSTVSSATFGQLFSCPVDGMVYAQPLWVANVTVAGASHNVVYVATENDTVYAFDADSPSCVQLWKTSFLGTGVTPLTPSDIKGNLDIGGPVIGITSTPVIDPATNTLYVMPKTRETVGTVSGQACSSGAPCYVHRLHALDLTTGAEKSGSPVVITATNFIPLNHLQRPALLLANGTIYLTFSSHGDQCPYWGWVMGYNASTLAQLFVKPLTNPNSGCVLGAGGVGAGGVWMAGAGPSTDSSGNVYVSTGNGAYDGTSNWGDSAVKLSPTGAILDWFTPFNQSTFFANDIDLSSAGLVMLPSSVGSAAHPNLAIATGKVAILYLLDVGTCSPQPCTTMGKFNSSSNHDVQEVIPVPPPNTTLADGGNYSDVAYWNGNIYTTGQNFPLSQFTISNGAISATQFAQSSNMFPPRGGVPSVAANSNTAGVVWITDYTGWQNNTPAILDAYDATNVGTMLYTSPASGAGSLGPAVKFTTPTVANSKVYIGTQNSIAVFGLLP